MKKSLALYLSLSVCLSLLVSCATTAPYQAMSDAKQALISARDYLNEQTPPSEADQYTYQLAEQTLQAAEKAINAKQYVKARTLIQQSQTHSQTLLIRRKQKNSNIRFRY